VFLCLRLLGAAKSRARQPKKLRRKLPRAGSKPTAMMQQTRATAQSKRGSRGRVRKGKPKKTIKINGLDLLHSQTLLSTSPQGELHCQSLALACLTEYWAVLSSETLEQRFSASCCSITTFTCKSGISECPLSSVTSELQTSLELRDLCRWTRCSEVAACFMKYACWLLLFHFHYPRRHNIGL
jgi:hypothetical protein